MFNKYYQDELTYLRELGREFATAYPALAPMLAERGGDADVERLLEGVAFLTARVREKLEDELPEAMVGIASLLFPELTRPRPGASILEITPHPNVLRDRLVVPAGAEFASVKVDGTACRFRSSVPCTIAPWVVEEASLELLASGKQHLRLDLRVTSQAPLGQFVPDPLRLHFAGDTAQSIDLLLWAREHTEEVQLFDARAKGGEARVLHLPKGSVVWRALEDGEGLLPADDTVLPAFRLLQEYYHLPAKFAFLDIEGTSALAELKEAGRVSIALVFDAPHPRITRLPKGSVRVNCVPVVNLFATTAEPLRITPQRGSYLVRPAGLPPAHGEVYRLEAVQGQRRGSGERFPIVDFFGFAHAADRASSQVFYTTHLRPSVSAEGADLSIAFGSATDGTVTFDADVVSVDLLATNRQLASAVRIGEISRATPTSPAAASFANIVPVTRSVPSPVGRDLHWRAVAHATMGLRSITDTAALRAALDVYNLEAMVDRQAARANELRIAAVRNVRVTPDERLYRGAIVRGVAVDVDLDESGFSGPGDMALFGAILDRLFSDYASINTFTRTSIHGVPSNARYPWPARSGTSTLL